MFTFLLILLLAAVGLLAYTYFGYVMFLEVLGWLRTSHAVKKRNVVLPVSIVIPAYNEEQAIAAKLDNILSLDFPRDRMEVVVVSDASTDRTDSIVKGYAGRGIKLVRLPARSGKIAAYRTVLPQLANNIIVFSDATSVLERDALRQLVANFADPRVGCAGAQVRFNNPRRAAVGKGVTTYWDYDTRIRMLESDLDSLLSVSGTLYAVRRSLYPMDLRDDLADDLIVPLHVKAQGARTILDPSAVCTEATTLNITEEMAKRTRITIQNIRGLANRLSMFNPLRYGLFSVFLFSHKLLRLVVPLLLLVVLGSSLVLGLTQPAFLAFAGLQLAFYVGGFAGYLMRTRMKPRVLDTVFYFCLSNVAILVGGLRYVRGARVTTWETLRRTEP